MTLPTVWTVHITVKHLEPETTALMAATDDDRRYVASARLGEIQADALARTERGAIGLVLPKLGELVLAAARRAP